MIREELRLNDFEGFDQFLFTEEELMCEEEIPWEKYYFKEAKSDICTFHPPIKSPRTLAEYQLDHYAFWMVIKTFELSRKPISNEPYCEVCYACRYSNEKKSNRCCPIKSWRGSGCFAPRSLYTRWQIGHNPDYADAIAHLEWEDY